MIGFFSISLYKRSLHMDLVISKRVISFYQPRWWLKVGYRIFWSRCWCLLLFKLWFISSFLNRQTSSPNPSTRDRIVSNQLDPLVFEGWWLLSKTCLQVESHHRLLQIKIIQLRLNSYLGGLHTQILEIGVLVNLYIYVNLSEFSVACTQCEIRSFL